MVHSLVRVFLVALWIPVYILAVIHHRQQPYRCTVCGSPAPQPLLTALEPLAPARSTVRRRSRALLSVGLVGGWIVIVVTLLALAAHLGGPSEPTMVGSAQVAPAPQASTGRAFNLLLYYERDLRAMLRGHVDRAHRLVSDVGRDAVADASLACHRGEFARAIERLAVRLDLTPAEPLTWLDRTSSAA